jgi:hypothetical protein
VIEECTAKKAIKNRLPQQPGDVKATYADVSALVEAVGYRPKVSLEEGMEPRNGTDMPRSRLGCPMTTYRQYRKWAFFFLFPRSGV